jgi:serine/threonine-protein kinase
MNRACVASLAIAALFQSGEVLMSPKQAPSAGLTIAADMPSTPLPGQPRPDASGRCPRRSQVAINGGCWLQLAADVKDCDEDGYVYKGACYIPAFPPPRPATANRT